MNYSRRIGPMGGLTDNLFGDVTSAAAYAGASLFPYGTAALTAGYLFGSPAAAGVPPDPAPTLANPAQTLSMAVSTPFIILATLAAIGLVFISEKNK